MEKLSKDNKSTKFKCLRCGRCCLEIGGCLSATGEDVQRWKAENRLDILKYVSIFNYGDWEAGDLWISPVTHDEMDKCPFPSIQKNENIYVCKIYESRPDVCRAFPNLKYDIAGQIIDINEWAEKNCPGVKAVASEI